MHTDPYAPTPRPRHAQRTLFAGLRFACAGVLVLWGVMAAAGERPAQTFQALAQVQAARLGPGHPPEVESAELADGMQADVNAVVSSPFEQVRHALDDPANWCAMMLLHINNRRCRLVQGADAAPTLVLSVVRRYDLPANEAFELPMTYTVAASSPDYLAIRLHSAEGPMGTSNHHVLLEATGVGPERTFLHFRYGYDHTALAKVATQAYLATFGSHKVGFTVVGKEADGTPAYIDGLRGLVERNAMRYFFTVPAYLEALDQPAAKQADRRRRGWYAMTQRYPRQLYEVDLGTYLALKQADARAQGER